MDDSNTNGNSDIYFTDYFTQTYGEGATYGDGEYEKAGYYVYYFDLQKKGWNVGQSVSITTNNANGKIYYRLFNDISLANYGDTDTSTDWTELGSTVNGTISYSFSTNAERYIAICVLWDGVSWTNAEISDMTLTYTSYVEWIYYDIFELDQPTFEEPQEPEFLYISCIGRDAWKKAIETQINLVDLTAGKACDQLIKDICDQIGISYTGTSIADLSGFANRTLSTGYGDSKENKNLPYAVDVFENIMEIINQGSTKYQMYIEYDVSLDDSILYVQPKPSTYASDFVFDYRHFVEMGTLRKNYDKVLKRITFITDQKNVNAEETLSTDNYTTAGQKTISWSGDAEYKSYTITLNSGTLPTITLDEVNPTSLKMTLGSGTFDITVVTKGNKWSSAPTFEGESIDHDNMINNVGTTSRIINPLIISDAEAGNIAQAFIDDNGDPVWESNNIRYPYLNLVLEINDMCFLWSRSVFTDDLRYITGYTYFWSSEPQDYSVFNLDDSGLDFSDEGDFVYDRDLYNTGNPIGYDTGYLYDMRFGVYGKESDVDISIYTTNVGEA